MQSQFQFSVKQQDRPETQRSGCAIVTRFSDDGLTTCARELDRASKGALSRRIDAEGFRAGVGDTLLIHALDGVVAERVLVLGLGKSKAVDIGALRKALTAALVAVARTGAKDAHLFIAGVDALDSESITQQAILAAGYADYRYTRTLSKPAPASKLRRLAVVTPKRPNAAQKRMQREASAIANGTNVARELANLPANICTPSYLAGQARELGRKHRNVSTRVLSEKQMRELGMDHCCR